MVQFIVATCGDCGCVLAAIDPAVANAEAVCKMINDALANECQIRVEDDPFCVEFTCDCPE